MKIQIFCYMVKMQVSENNSSGQERKEEKDVSNEVGQEGQSNLRGPEVE